MTLIQFSRQFMLRTLLTIGLLLLLFLALSAFSQKASAHGYVDSPASRAIQCKSGVNKDCGQIVYEPQSLEAPKGFPAAGPADGKIASAAGAFPKLDEQSSTRWSKVSITPGTKTITWKFTANHATSKFHYYITKPDWDPNKPLTRDQLDLTPFCTLEYEGNKPPAALSHDCEVPVRTGYHIILAVWDVADTANAFYNVIDVDFGNGEADNEAPSAPDGLTVSNISSTTAALAWNASSDNVGIAGYYVYSGNSRIATVTDTDYTVNGLTAETSYAFSVRAFDAAGNVSAPSNVITVTTAAAPAAYPEWSSSTVYVGGNIITYNGLNYEAKWWTLGEIPGKADVWKLIP